MPGDGTGVRAARPMRQSGDMAITLPLPVRVAAGLLVTGIQLVRSLPEEIPGIPVTLVGNAMRLSMKVQQEITTLATRGDELLGGIIGGRAQENPSWATFDEDKPTSAVKAPSRPSATPTVRTKPAPPAPTPAVSPAPHPAPTPPPVVQTPPATPDVPVAASLAAVPDLPEPDADEPDRHQPEATSLSDIDTTATEAAAGVPAALIDAALHAVPDRPAPDQADGTDEPQAAETDDPAPRDSTAEAQGAATPAESTESTEPAGDDPAVEPDGPATLPGYDAMTLAQVRGHLRELSVADVTDLLAYEQAGENRAPFLTLLSNRLVTLGAQES